MSASGKEVIDKSSKIKEKKKQQNESQSNDKPAVQRVAIPPKETIKKSAKQPENVSTQQLQSFAESVRIRPAASSASSISQINNKEFSTAPDVIQLKKFKGFKLFNHLQYQCDYSAINKLPYVK